MQKATSKKAQPKSPAAGAKRKLTRAEKKQIAEVIQTAKGDGKPHTAQQTIPYMQMFPDGICHVSGKRYSKTVAFEDINYQLAQADDKTAIFENWCDFLNYFDASVQVQLLLASREVENIFENSDFVLMLNQAAGDRAILAKQLNISPQQMKYVTHSEAGEGLIFYGNVVLPFVDRFPKDTELYRVMTTKPEEVEGA